MGAGDMTSPGMTLSSATSDLVLSSTRNLALDGIAWRSPKCNPRDMAFPSSASDRGRRPRYGPGREPGVNGLTFSRSVSSILMEATTIRRTRQFPGQLDGQLNGLKARSTESTRTSGRPSATG